MTELTSFKIKIPSDQPIPEPLKCEFCGNTLPYNALVLFGAVQQWVETECDCNQAIAWRAEQQKAEEERLQAEQLERERLENIERIQQMLGNSGIKKRFLSRTMATFQETEENRMALAIAQEYIKNYDKYREQGIGLYFEGSTGTGKTHLAVAVALQLISNGVPVLFRTFGELLLELRKTFNPRSTITEDQILSVYREAELLVIDDLGKETPSEWTIDRLYYIINDRYENMLPTIITTNYNQTDLIKRLTPKGGDSKTAAAVVSRLHECADVVSMIGEDWRARK